MSPESLANQVRSLENQLAVLKAQIGQLVPAEPRGTFAELYGILQTLPPVDEQDLEDAKYRFTWDGKREG